MHGNVTNLVRTRVRSMVAQIAQMQMQLLHSTLLYLIAINQLAMIQRLAAARLCRRKSKELPQGGKIRRSTQEQRYANGAMRRRKRESSRASDGWFFAGETASGLSADAIGKESICKEGEGWATVHFRANGVARLAFHPCIAPGTVITEKSCWTRVCRAPLMAVKIADPRIPLRGIVAPLLRVSGARPRSSARRTLLDSPLHSAARYISIYLGMRERIHANGYYVHHDAYNVFLSASP